MIIYLIIGFALIMYNVYLERKEIKFIMQDRGEAVGFTCFLAFIILVWPILLLYLVVEAVIGWKK